MSIHEQNDSFRGCSSKFPQPLSGDNLTEAKDLFTKIHRINVLEGKKLAKVKYGTKEYDMSCAVYRFDKRHYDEIFMEDFQAKH